MKFGAGILFTDGHKMLLLKRAEGDGENTWGLPGGGAKDGESPLQTAKREVREECGISQIPGTKWTELTQEGNDFTWTTFLYAVKVPFDVGELSSEHSDSSWVNLSEIGSKTLHPKLKPQIPDYLGLIRRKFGQKFTEWMRLRNIVA